MWGVVDYGTFEWYIILELIHGIEHSIIELRRC